MHPIRTLREQHRLITSSIECYSEPYRTRASRWLNVGKVALVLGAADMIGISTANAVLGFESHQEALQHQLANIQVYGFAGSLALGLATVAGIGSAERQNRSVCSPDS